MQVFNYKGGINRVMPSKPKKEFVPLPRLTKNGMKELEYYMNTHIFVAYAAMRECNKVIDLCNSCFGKKELLYPQVQKFIEDCNNAKSFLQIVMNDYMAKCKNQEGEERVAKLLMFAYDCAAPQIEIVRKCAVKAFTEKSEIKKKRIKVLAQILSTQMLVLLVFRVCSMVDAKYKPYYPYINDFTHIVDISNVAVALDKSLSFLLDGEKNHCSSDPDFQSQKALLNTFLTEKTLYSRCCDSLNYTP